MLEKRMMMAEMLSEGREKAEQLLKKANDIIELLPPTVANFMIVTSAQGVIDNGGFRYFFGADWRNKPPYSQVIEAYKAIGCDLQAKELERVTATFPFKDPHLYKELRKKYIRDNFDPEELEVNGWGDTLCGDEEVWARLEEYYLENIQDFA